MFESFDGVWDLLKAIGAIIFFIVVIALVFISPYFEAKNFNDCTKGRATYWTAVFTELRVQDCK
jgi:hypothetical protein